MASAFAVRKQEICNTLKSEVTIHYNGKSITTIALWDTGATNSCVSKKVVSDLGLVMTGKAPMKTPSGQRLANTYLVDVTLPNDVPVPDLMVCDSEIGSQGIGMLIGMDIINKGDFTVSNHQGKTVFSFRMPSEGVMDFVTGIKMSNIIKANRTHNNKFKQKRKK